MENLYPLLFGLIGTVVMTFVLYTAGQSGVGKAAMVKGVGSSIPTPVGGSLLPGAIVHVVAGILFGYVFWALGRAWAYLVPGELLALGVGVGIVRGVVVSIVLGLIAFDQRPLERMGEVGFGVGLTHVIGNVIYGLVVALLYGVTAVDFMLSF